MLLVALVVSHVLVTSLSCLKITLISINGREQRTSAKWAAKKKEITKQQQGQKQNLNSLQGILTHKWLLDQTWRSKTLAVLPRPHFACLNRKITYCMAYKTQRFYGIQLEIPRVQATHTLLAEEITTQSLVHLAPTLG